MTDALARLECRLDSVEHALSDLEHRLQALETTGTPLSAGTPAVAYAELHPVAASPADVASTLGLLGRTLVVFAGAYLLRALTESGTLAVPTGIALGLAYAAVWSVVAFRTGAVSRLSATLFGGCTIVLALPLLFEATTRFDLLSPAASATALALATAVVLAVAWRRDLHALAWVAVLGACVLASVLLVETGRAIPFVTALAGLGVATLWLGYEREWKMLRWVSAVVADLAVLALVGRALADPPRDAPAAVLAVQLLLLVGYLASIAVRTLVRGRTVVLFEAVQTAALLIVGLAGAVVVASRAGTGVAVLGVSLLVLAAAAYAVAFAFFERHPDRRANFHFYTSVALVLALCGSRLVLGDALLVYVWTGLAVLAGWAGERYQRHALVVHSVVYVTAAFVVSGLAGTFLTAMVGQASGVWRAPGVVTWAAAAGVTTCLWLATREGNCAGPFAQHALAILIAAAVSGLAIVMLRDWLPVETEAPLHAAAVATLRSGVLAGSAMLVAWLGRYARTRPFGALLYPVLAVGAVKLLFEDMRTSPPKLLFVAFALYGIALILGPRLARTQPQARVPAAMV